MRTLALFAPIYLVAASAAAQVRPLPCNERCVQPRPQIGARIARTSSEARVTLDGHVLRYVITESYVNRGGTLGEADYVLPLPHGAVFDNLALEINGELVEGETLPADRARSVYEEIVRKQRDPALVEWMDFGLLRARIFPIAPGETKTVVVRFTVVAPREGNALRVDYLSGGRTPGTIESAATPSFVLQLPRGDAFGTPYSPTHQLTFNDQHGVPEVRAVGDASRLTLLVPVTDAGHAIVTALPYAPGGEDGFALITLSPPARHSTPVARDVTFVVDISGSMSGAKLDQAKAAGRTLLGTLGANDRFRLISFSTDVDNFRDGWSPADDESLRAARHWLDDLRAAGSTNISGALDAALAVAVPRDRLAVVLFLTDGQATIGERNPDRLAALAAAKRGAQRIFTFGVGTDVQAALLERMALEGHGTAHFVQPSEDVEYAVGVVAQHLTAPVATNVHVRADGVTLRQLQPNDAQDVFVGQDLVVAARYHGNGQATIVFEGESPSGPVRWTERVNFPSQSRDNAFVAKLWAVQRVGWLSAERRRSGANTELDNELRDLGTRFGIPTELTSYLVVEPGQPVSVLRAGSSRPTGTAAPPQAQNEFDQARAASEQRAAKSLADAIAAGGSITLTRDEKQRKDVAVRQVGERTFLQHDGAWIDSRYRDSVRRVMVKPFSAAYFALIARIPELQPIFALGERVTAGGRGVVLMLDAQGADTLSASELANIARDW